LRESSKLFKLENKVHNTLRSSNACSKTRQGFFACVVLQILYKAEEFEYSPRERFDLSNEAYAVYQVAHNCEDQVVEAQRRDRVFLSRLIIKFSMIFLIFL
jgi:hypothetical protein